MLDITSSHFGYSELFIMALNCYFHQYEFRYWVRQLARLSTRQSANYYPNVMDEISHLNLNQMTMCQLREAQASSFIFMKSNYNLTSTSTNVTLSALLPKDKNVLPVIRKLAVFFFSPPPLKKNIYSPNRTMNKNRCLRTASNWRRCWRSQE